jgi:hypothetical protein
MDMTDSKHLTSTRTDAAWLDAHWMPFSGNRNFKADPRMIVADRFLTVSRACGAAAWATPARS